MKRSKLYISTIASDAKVLAKEYGLGLEIAEFCTAFNMDVNFDEYMEIVEGEMKHSSLFTFHAPFNELCPAAIDPLIREVTYKRYIQAIELSKSLGIKKIIVHSGYIPLIYYREYFISESVSFWKNLLSKLDDDITICLENVMEEDPYFLKEIAEKVNDERFRLCLDIGHANAVSKIPVIEWVKEYSDLIEHYHIHDNMGEKDSHSTLGNGNIDLKSFFELSSRITPNATYAIENMEAIESVRFLIENGILED